MTKLLRVSMLLLCFIAGISASSAEKLYLSNIECVRNIPYIDPDAFTYKAYFLYDEDDNVNFFRIRQYMNEFCVGHWTQILPASATFVFTPKYKNGEKYMNINYYSTLGEEYSADVSDEQLESGFMTCSKVHGGYFNDSPCIYDLTSEYNMQGNLVNIQRKAENVEENFTYEYTYNSNDNITKIECKNSEDTVVAYWLLEYYDNNLLKRSKYYHGIEDMNENGEIEYITYFNCNYHEFYYYDEDVHSPDDIVVSPRPLTFFYDALNVNPRLWDTFTFYMHECIANILWNQKGKKIKTIKQKEFSDNINGSDSIGEEYDSLIGYWHEFEFRYQTERPTAGVEAIAADEDVTPMYFNIQGMPVSNPSEGEIYIVRRGSKATKEVFRR